MTLLQSFLDCLSPIRIWIIGVIQLSFVVLEGNKSWRWLTILQFRNEIKKFWPEAFRPSHTNMLQNEGPQEMNEKKYTPLLFCCGFHEIMSHNIWKKKSENQDISLRRHCRVLPQIKIAVASGGQQPPDAAQKRLIVRLYGVILEAKTTINKNYMNVVFI